MPAKAAPAAKPAAAKPAAKKAKQQTVAQWKKAHSHLFPAAAKNLTIGGDRQQKRDVTRFVKMPLYVRIQRQRAVLKQRVKVPAAINQFATKCLKKDHAATLFKLMAKYRPETVKARKERVQKQAAVQAENKEAKKTEKPSVLTFGLDEVVKSIEKKRAKLVVIANDVAPIELVVFLPALCKKMNVPYVIVKNKARLGYLVHKKQAAVVSMTSVAAADQPTLQQIIDATTALQASRSKTGGLKLSVKTLQAEQKKKAALANTIRA